MARWLSQGGPGPGAFSCGFIVLRSRMRGNQPFRGRLMRSVYITESRIPLEDMDFTAIKGRVLLKMWRKNLERLVAGGSGQLSRYWTGE